MLHVDIWADFGCPACYLAKPRIDQAITASGHADAATRAGVSAARAKALLTGDEYADAVRADEKLAQEAGVSAVPFTILGGRLAIPAAATADAYADAITQALTTGDPQ